MRKCVKCERKEDGALTPAFYSLSAETTHACMHSPSENQAYLPKPYIFYSIRQIPTLFLVIRQIVQDSLTGSLQYVIQSLT